MGLPAWAYGEQVPLSEWEDRGAYLYNRRTGEKRPKGASGGITNLTKPGDLPPEELQERLDAWTEHLREAEARGERNGQPMKRGDPFIELLFSLGGPDRKAQTERALAIREQAAGSDRSNLEDRRGQYIREPPTPYADVLGAERPSVAIAPGQTLPSPLVPDYTPMPDFTRHRPAAPAPGREREWGEDSSYPGHLYRGKSVDEMLPGDRALAEADMAWKDLYASEDRPGQVEGTYETTRSPLVLRKRNPNGTVTYVHAMTGHPLFDKGEYGLNDDESAEFDPFWRAGRREW